MRYAKLVPTEALGQNFDNPGWVVFDCRHDLADPARGRREYAEGHVPGARFLHLDDDLSSPGTGTNGRHPLPDLEVLRGKLARAGVAAGSQVVAYDAQGGMIAARLWWLLRGLGHEAVAVLDGGWGKWVAEGGPRSSATPTPKPAVWNASRRPDFVDARFVLSHLHDPAVVLLDARAPDRFRGQNETLDPVGGRIPGARNRFFRDNLDARGCFKPADRLKADFLGVLDAGRNVVHYCGSGVSACHNILAMTVAGLPPGQLYAGSWSEWCADRSRPAAAGEPGPGER
jgi:thiosulfate/3-mercaptopyruvate sulfurtransferase